MKRDQQPKSPASDRAPLVLRDVAPPYSAPEREEMVRTQIYLSRREHEFVQLEAAKRNLPMAALIREYIDQKMNVPEDAWQNNPLLELPVAGPGYRAVGDGVANHDHYIYGTPKREPSIKRLGSKQGH